MGLLKPISISLSPNTERDDVWLVLKLIFQPWKWRWGSAVEKLEEEFKRYLGVKEALAFNSGRSAFLAILKSLNFNEGDEVLLQAFTCNAAANPIIWAGLRPIYVDCNEDDFNIDVKDLERKITPKSRVVVVQHTFGLPANIDEILEICQQNNLILIEDCAHSLGAEYKGKKVGTFGKAAFFSFSRDKVISSVYGGMVATNDDNLAKKLKNYNWEAGLPTNCWVLQQLFHPVLMNWLILPTYRALGKYLLVLFQWLHVLSKAVHWKEKRGERPSYFPKKMPNALAILALNQFKKIVKFNNHRKEIADFYYEKIRSSSFELPRKFPKRENIYLRFTVKHPKAHEIIRKAWDNNLLIGDWYTTPIAPDDTKLEKVQYKLGSCPKAEKLSEITLNLPTHINILEKEARQVVDFLKKF